MKEIGACIFDLDGVICDTAKYHYLAWKRLAQQLGFVFLPEDNERLKGVSRMESLEILLSVGDITASDEEKRVWAEQKNNWYVDAIKKMGPDEILPGVKEFLIKLREMRIKIGLGSASKNANMILEQLGIKSYFDGIVDGTMVSNAKPDPEVFLKAAEQLGILPSNCIVFEDAVAGVEAAKRANMKCIGVGSKLVLQNADLVIDGFDVKGTNEISKMVGKCI